MSKKATNSRDDSILSFDKIFCFEGKLITGVTQKQRHSKFLGKISRKNISEKFDS